MSMPSVVLKTHEFWYIIEKVTIQHINATNERLEFMLRWKESVLKAKRRK